MRLADFLEQEQEAILTEWEAFARTMLPASGDMTRIQLRDHAKEILHAIALDLRTYQSAHQQSEKAQGRAHVLLESDATAAQTHAVLRAASGFDINQLVAEYRAMRACVLDLWIASAPPEWTALDDMLRFNEAIDQAVAESVRYFDAEVNHARNLLLGALGHDMRSPLATVLQTAASLRSVDAGPEVSTAANRLLRSGTSLKVLLDDLVDFSRTQLGLGLIVIPTDIDLADVIADELEQLRGANPDRVISLAVEGDATGRWDGDRVHQVLRNLVANALSYGSATEPVAVTVRGDGSDVHIEVTNRGVDLAPLSIVDVFVPLRRGTDQGDGLGLGLFIVRAIAEAHGGEVAMHSAEGETSFRVRLPRR
jgi:signal transduction histidine kinase